MPGWVHAEGGSRRKRQPTVWRRKTVKTLINRFVREEDGQDIIEYSLLAAFISVVAWITLQNIGQDVEVMYSEVNKATNDAAS